MKRYIKFVMSKGADMTVDEETAKKILTSPQQIHPYYVDGVWTGQSINKAFMIGTQLDTDKMQAEADREARARIKLAAPEISEEQRKRNVEGLARMREELVRKKVLSPRRKKA